MGDAYGARLTVYEHSPDFPPRSIGEDAEVSKLNDNKRAILRLLQYQKSFNRARAR